MRAKGLPIVLAAVLVTVTSTGCTVWGEKKHPSLGTTTSAEQHERILWTKIRDGAWQDIPPMFAQNVVYAVRGRLLSRDEIIPFLRSEQIHDFVLGDVTVKPNGPDMTVSYTVQVSGSDGKTQSLIATSVWQQARSGWILIAHSQQPQEQ